MWRFKGLFLSKHLCAVILFQVLKQDIQDNKPLVDKLNKTGTALSKLYLSEDDLELVKSTVDDDNRRVEDIRRAMRDRSMSIDEALQQSAEVGLITIMTIRAQWLSGRVLDSRPRGRGFEPHQRHCLVSLSKTH